MSRAALASVPGCTQRVHRCFAFGLRPGYPGAVTAAPSGAGRGLGTGCLAEIRACFGCGRLLSFNGPVEVLGTISFEGSQQQGAPIISGG